MAKAMADKTFSPRSPVPHSRLSLSKLTFEQIVIVCGNRPPCWKDPTSGFTAVTGLIASLARRSDAMIPNDCQAPEAVGNASKLRWLNWQLSGWGAECNAITLIPHASLDYAAHALDCSLRACTKPNQSYNVAYAAWFDASAFRQIRNIQRKAENLMDLKTIMLEYLSKPP